MPAADFDFDLLHDVQVIHQQGWWHVTVHYDQSRYQLGRWQYYDDAHHACTRAAMKGALGTAEKRIARLMKEEAHR